MMARRFMCPPTKGLMSAHNIASLDGARERQKPQPLIKLIVRDGSKGDIELAVALIEQCLPYTLTLARIQLAN